MYIKSHRRLIVLVELSLNKKKWRHCQRAVAGKLNFNVVVNLVTVLLLLGATVLGVAVSYFAFLRLGIDRPSRLVFFILGLCLGVMGMQGILKEIVSLFMGYSVSKINDFTKITVDSCGLCPNLSDFKLSADEDGVSVKTDYMNGISCSQTIPWSHIESTVEVGDKLFLMFNVGCYSSIDYSSHAQYICLSNILDGYDSFKEELVGMLKRYTKFVEVVTQTPEELCSKLYAFDYYNEDITKFIESLPKKEG